MDKRCTEMTVTHVDRRSKQIARNSELKKSLLEVPIYKRPPGQILLTWCWKYVRTATIQRPQLYIYNSTRGAMKLLQTL